MSKIIIMGLLDDSWKLILSKAMKYKDQIKESKRMYHKEARKMGRIDISNNEETESNKDNEEPFIYFSKHDVDSWSLCDVSDYHSPCLAVH